jgi:hypothetical protein
MKMRSEDLHYIFYPEDELDDRQYWECQTCSKAGSVGEFGNPELAAEQSHGFPCGVTNRGGDGA